MSDYDLYYWPIPLRGQFVRALLAYAGKTWTEHDGAAIVKYWNTLSGYPGYFGD